MLNLQFTMPKNLMSTLNALIKKFSPNFTTDGKVLLCKICEKSVSFHRKFLVVQHIESATHQKALKRNQEKKSQMFLCDSVNQDRKSDYFAEMVEAFVSANIPFWKLENKTFASFLAKYTGKETPSESTLRKNYVKVTYDNMMDYIRKQLNDKLIWVSMDETIDLRGRYVANAVVGILSSNKEDCKVYLVNSQILEKVNHNTIAAFFDDSLKLISENFDRSKVLLLVTDAAPYMIKAARGLQVLYSKMIHVTCVAHGLHRLVEYIRQYYQNIDNWVGNLKKIFIKAPSRVQIFKEVAPDLALPPKPVITRWGTWISTVNYSNENLTYLEDILRHLNDDVTSVNLCKLISSNPIFKNNLAFISGNYGYLPEILDILQKRNALLTESFSLLDKTVKSINEVKGHQGEEVSLKMQNILANNKGLEILRQIALIHAGEYIETHYSPKEITAFKYAPLVSCEVERSFSVYKDLLTCKRTNLSNENLKYHMVIACNTK